MLGEGTTGTLQSERHASFCGALQSVRKNLESPPHGGRSSMVELQIVVLAVAGSSPVGHPPSCCGGGTWAGRPALVTPFATASATRGFLSFSVRRFLNH